MQRDKVQHVFLVGAKSLGAYGGYETFINKLTEYHQSNERIKYHVACKANGDGCMDPYKGDDYEPMYFWQRVRRGAGCVLIRLLIGWRQLTRRAVACA